MKKIIELEHDLGDEMHHLISKENNDGTFSLELSDKPYCVDTIVITSDGVKYFDFRFFHLLKSMLDHDPDTGELVEGDTMFWRKDDALRLLDVAMPSAPLSKNDRLYIVDDGRVVEIRPCDCDIKDGKVGYWFVSNKKSYGFFLHDEIGTEVFRTREEALASIGEDVNIPSYTDEEREIYDLGKAEGILKGAKDLVASLKALKVTNDVIIGVLTSGNMQVPEVIARELVCGSDWT